MDEQRITPGRWPYLLAGLIAAAGVALCAGFVVAGVRSFSGAGNVRMLAPGAKTLTLDRTGKYIIYHENPGRADGKTYAPAGLPGSIECTLVRKDSGEEIAVGPSGANYTYNTPGANGRSIRSFDIDRPGDYELTAGYSGGATGPKTVLMIGPSPAGGVMKIVGSCVALPMSLVAAITIVVVTLVKRSGAKKRLAGPPPLVSAGPPGPPPQAPPPQA